MIFICSFCIGYQAAMKIYRFSLIGLLWGKPCIPLYSPASGFRLLKPKSAVRVFPKFHYSLISAFL